MGKTPSHNHTTYNFNHTTYNFNVCGGSVQGLLVAIVAVVQDRWSTSVLWCLYIDLEVARNN